MTGRGSGADGRQVKIRKNLPGDNQSMRWTLIFMVTLTPLGLGGCSGVGSGGSPSVAAPPTQPAIPTGPALGGVLGGPLGAALTDEDRQAAREAQIAALDSGQRQSWRGSHGVFGFVEAGAETGEGCRAFSQTIYVAGRPNRGRGVGCKQPDGSWKMTS
jgi:surface antigen